MNFHNLTSLVAGQKRRFAMPRSSESFAVASPRKQPYIEPTFEKVEFHTEKPAVILVSAVGVTGKSTLAHVLSSTTGLPLLDLAKHKPVGDNTLTGLLTTAFEVEDLSKIFEGIQQGTFGVIIDGVDEGRSKTTEKAFEAFLDDIVRLCGIEASTSFVLLGRPQILEHCWLYLTETGASAGLLTISPFDLDAARRYIDAFSGGIQSPYLAQYEEARETILSLLSAAFSDGAGTKDESFLTFTGYPPVLDAIVTALTQESNYHRLLQELQHQDLTNVEIRLLHRITSYILSREKYEKVLPNFVDSLISGMNAEQRESIRKRVFEPEEQCLRLVSYCLDRPLALGRIGEPVIDKDYEERLLAFLPDHPFITGRGFRNAVFEAVALATLIASNDAASALLVLDYLNSNKYNYYLVYFLDLLAPDGKVPLDCLRVILESALELRSRTTSIELQVTGPDVGEIPASPVDGIVETQIEVTAAAEGEKSKTFVFHSKMAGATSVQLGARLSSTYVSLPCEVVLSGAEELELKAPVEICETKISLQAASLILRHAAKDYADENEVILDAEEVASALQSVTTNDVQFIVFVPEQTPLSYPLTKYMGRRDQLAPDPALREKYLRMKRALVHFRSHGRGQLAKLRAKIENERVLGNATGRAILGQLLRDQILTLDDKHYILQPQNVDRFLGVSYNDLRQGRTSPKLIEYLASIR